MSPRSRHSLWIALVLTATAAAGCRRPVESGEPTVPAVAEDTPALATPEPTPVGRHALTASPPATTAELDRLLGIGFTPQEVAAEIDRRGVLRRPDASERAHILSLPRGELLLDAMEASRNLLSPDAVSIYGRVQAGGPNPAQWQAGRNTTADHFTYAAQTRYQSLSARDQQMVDYQRRSNDLIQRINRLKIQRTGMQRRGEMTATITMEIERLEREAAALMPPP